MNLRKRRTSPSKNSDQPIDKDGQIEDKQSPEEEDIDLLVQRLVEVGEQFPSR